MKVEKWLNSDHFYKGRIFDLRVGKVLSEDENIVEREIIEHPGGVAIVPVFEDNSILLIRQFRISIGREIFELPGGRIEPGDSPEKRAENEL